MGGNGAGAGADAGAAAGNDAGMLKSVFHSQNIHH